MGVENDELVFAWVLSSDESEDETMRVGRALYDDIAQDAGGGWAKLHGAITAGPFVDINRMLIAQTP